MKQTQKTISSPNGEGAGQTEGGDSGNQGSGDNGDNGGGGTDNSGGNMDQALISHRNHGNHRFERFPLIGKAA